MFVFDKRAEKEFREFPKFVQVRIESVLFVLRRNGKLVEPYGKKIDNQLFEVGVKHNGQWRLLYAYGLQDNIIVLSAFQKKTQETPMKEFNKAKERLKRYI